MYELVALVRASKWQVQDERGNIEASSRRQIQGRSHTRTEFGPSARDPTISTTIMPLTRPSDGCEACPSCQAKNRDRWAVKVGQFREKLKEQDEGEPRKVDSCTFLCPSSDDTTLVPRSRLTSSLLSHT